MSKIKYSLSLASAKHSGHDLSGVPVSTERSVKWDFFHMRMIKLKSHNSCIFGNDYHYGIESSLNNISPVFIHRSSSVLV